MFCPECGLENSKQNQFCRSCGTDLRGVRAAILTSDDVTASAVSAREEIGRAVAARIRATTSADELAKVTEEVLPEIEKFLESPEEKRLRRLRNGTVVSAIGIGVAIAMAIVSIAKEEPEILFLAGLGLVTFFIGIGLIVNGIFLSLPKDRAKKVSDGERGELVQAETSDLKLPAARTPFSDLFGSVTEHTTKHLEKRK